MRGKSMRRRRIKKDPPKKLKLSKSLETKSVQSKSKKRIYKSLHYTTLSALLDAFVLAFDAYAVKSQKYAQTCTHHTHRVCTAE